MHLFFNDPRVGYVTRHRRIVRPSLAVLVVGGVGVAALGVIVGSAGYDVGSGVGPPRSDDGGFAMPVATPGGGPGVNANGPLGMGTVPAAPVPIPDLGVTPSVAPPPDASVSVEKKAVVRVESTTHPLADRTTAAVVTDEPEPNPTEEPEALADQNQDGQDRGDQDQGGQNLGGQNQGGEDQSGGRLRWHQDRRQNQWGDGQNQWGDAQRWRPWWERQ
ncbi:hypothetical protein ACPPVO_58715 [Dactylosporangium sp. McL0621]|uniref:hypothetical protein n=1 Tax=Dactylosporangium sp. McL0621 TaxID=3415678 RepID=UPI003CF7B596